MRNQTLRWLIVVICFIMGLVSCWFSARTIVLTGSSDWKVVLSGTLITISMLTAFFGKKRNPKDDNE